MSKFINMARRNGKTTILIHTSFVTGYPIIVNDTAQKKFILDQAKARDLDITVYTLREWIEGERLNHLYAGVLIDEAETIIEKALEYYLGTHVIAYTATIPIKEIKKDKEKGGVTIL